MTVLLERADARLEVCNERTLKVDGEADFDSAASLAAKGREWLLGLPRDTEVEFDLTGVDCASSAVLSVLLEWLRSAQAHDIHIRHVTLSPPLVRLTTMAELGPLLPDHEARAPSRAS
ncbi:phospholipid transport system transporter-binding protein [Chromohalobacter marismortui]|uniref:Phospholipid transport system transporter-binding protein n=1 Tax=Chromohalobacter marismortui TaxID=42055 RepID=A0A4R7NQY9_9GAMM|nr:MULTISPECIES: STAS domain-containing protein [Chromohalobacter]MCI0508549.1 STAS domain-containing protein [Chromohalobacter sp.]MCI0592504.1 STAS domain-containing protein [Chromohalobacter sp.]TDU23029.1 phospholipid transport system transporter-binding protein [Chromohalobacter marismortui]